jgi:glucose/mannose-6-phosphate isomerase
VTPAGGERSSPGVSPLSVDTLAMWAATAGLPEQVEAAARVAAELDGLPHSQPISNVVALGMGGSGIAGDVMAAVAAPQMAIPVTVVKSYDLPAFVGPDTLVFAVSCSGDTEETVQAAGAAWAAGASVVAVCSGGELARRAAQAGSPVLAVPADIPQPRAALGAMAVPPLVVLERLGFLEGAGAGVALAVEQLGRRRDQLVGAANPAQEIARRIGRTIPLVHGSSGLAGVAAQRWKTQINENAKSPAFFSLQPELCHNEVAGWGQHGDVTRQLCTLVTLRHDNELPQVSRRFDLVGQVLAEVVADVVEVRAEGRGELAQFFDLALLGDFVSLYLAGREEIDPGPVPVLAEIKDRLREA